MQSLLGCNINKIRPFRDNKENKMASYAFAYVHRDRFQTVALDRSFDEEFEVSDNGSITKCNELGINFLHSKGYRICTSLSNDLIALSGGEAKNLLEVEAVLTDEFCGPIIYNEGKLKTATIRCGAIYRK